MSYYYLPSGQVLKPQLGEVVPHRVSASVVIDVSRFSGDIRLEWESLREHDGELINTLQLLCRVRTVIMILTLCDNPTVLFLVTIESPQVDASAIVTQYEE